MAIDLQSYARRAVEWWGAGDAQHVVRDLCEEHGQRPRLTLPLPGGVWLPMIWVYPGTYLQGSPPDEHGRCENEGPQRKVTLTRGFWLGETPVTQAQWFAVMGNNPSRFQEAGNPEAPQRPVERVSWEDAVAFAKAVEVLHPGFGARLPTEAEWEYACRAGTATATYAGDLNTQGDLVAVLDGIAWYGANAEGGTHPVGQKRANPWGFHDMLGNVLEWCLDGAEDWSDPYEPGPVTDPMRGADPFGFHGVDPGTTSHEKTEAPTELSAGQGSAPPTPDCASPGGDDPFAECGAQATTTTPAGREQRTGMPTSSVSAPTAAHTSDSESAAGGDPPFALSADAPMEAMASMCGQHSATPTRGTGGTSTGETSGSESLRGDDPFAVSGECLVASPLDGCGQPPGLCESAESRAFETRSSDSAAPAGGEHKRRLLRGGRWAGANEPRSAYRYPCPSTLRSSDVGFRLSGVAC